MSSALADRLLWVLLHRKTRVRSASHWSQAAGLTRSHVRVTIARRGTMSAESVYALARAAGVSPTWLASGEGTPEETRAPAVRDACAPRRQATEALQLDELVSDRAVAAARAVAAPSWTSAQWRDLLLRLSLADARGDDAAFSRALTDAEPNGDDDSTHVRRLRTKK